MQQFIESLSTKQRNAMIELDCTSAMTNSMFIRVGDSNISDLHISLRDMGLIDIEVCSHEYTVILTSKGQQVIDQLVQ